MCAYVHKRITAFCLGVVNRKINISGTFELASVHVYKLRAYKKKMPFTLAVAILVACFQMTSDLIWLFITHVSNEPNNNDDDVEAKKKKPPKEFAKIAGRYSIFFE